MSQNIDFGDSYQKYMATGENGVLIPVRIGVNANIKVSHLAGVRS